MAATLAPKPTPSQTKQLQETKQNKETKQNWSFKGNIIQGQISSFSFIN